MFRLEYVKLFSLVITDRVFLIHDMIIYSKYGNAPDCLAFVVVLEIGMRVIQSEPKAESMDIVEPAPVLSLLFAPFASSIALENRQR